MLQMRNLLQSGKKLSEHWDCEVYEKMGYNMQRYGVIMAGGGGTRFWPLSRQKTPKQMLNLSGKELMINETIDRMATVVPMENIFVVTAAVQAPDMLTATTGRVNPEHVLAEPAARNTAACIGYAAMEIMKKYGDGVMLITPADHYIKDVSTLTKLFDSAIDAAEKTDKLVTIGVRPTFASTGFGYIKYQRSDETAMPVVEFREKPDAETAQQYVASGEYVWNSGMFIWKASVILEKFREYIPDIYADLERIGTAMGTEDEKNVIAEVYPNIRKISIDYAIMEPSAVKGDVLTVPGNFGWNDVGSWDMMSVLHEPDEHGNVLLGNTLAIDTTNSICYSSGKLVSVVGLDNMIVVETPDAILVCPKDRAQDVKLIVDQLSEQEKKEYL